MTPTLEQLTLCTGPGVEPKYSPHGHIITADGTTYALCHRYHHGVVLALLFPEVFAAYDPTVNERRAKPTFDVEEIEDLDVFAFQDFEMEHSRSLQVVRYCATRFSGIPSLDLPSKGCTQAQFDSMRAMLTVQGHRVGDEICLQACDTRVSRALHWAMLPEEERA